MRHHEVWDCQTSWCRGVLSGWTCLRLNFAGVRFSPSAKPCTLVMVGAPGEHLAGPMQCRGRYLYVDWWPESGLRARLLPGYTGKTFSPLSCRF